MGTSPVNELLSLWAHEKLTAEQAIGHLLQHIELLQSRIAYLEQQITKLTSVPERVERLEQRVAAKAQTTTTRSRRKRET